METGKIVLSGLPEQLINSEEVIKAYLADNIFVDVWCVKVKDRMSKKRGDYFP
jgi:hypothetical protein